MLNIRQTMTIDRVDAIMLKSLLRDVEYKTTYAGQKQVWTALVPAAFDIEATRQFMYIWTFSIKYVTIIGYTWEDYKHLLEMLKEAMNLGVHVKKVTHKKDNDKKGWKKGDVTEEHSAPYVLPIFIHNLRYEYSFMKNEFLFNDTFFMDKRERNPMYLLDGNFFYIDSYKVFPKKLEKLAEAFCKTKKKTGDLDYSIERNTNDAKKLSALELGYCVADTQILVEFAQFVFDNYFIPYGRLPLTQNQIVESLIHAKFMAKTKEDRESIMKELNAMTLNQSQYKFIRRDGFRGGYCHSSLGENYEGVIYGDETSAYGNAIMHGYYPMTAYDNITEMVTNEKAINRYANLRCCQMRLKFYNIRSKGNKVVKLESRNKVVRWMADGTKPETEEDRKQLDEMIKTTASGRIWKAACFSVSISEITWELYKKCYEWDRVEIKRFEVAKRGELPDYIKEAFIEAYEVKAALKLSGIKGPKYESAKLLVNNVFGCMVKKIISDLVNGEEDDWWHDQRDRELKPQWGVYIAEHARKALIDVILDIGEDWLYSDTDSIYANKNEHTKAVFEKYNKIQREKNKQMCDKLGLNYDLWKDLGCWDDDSKDIIAFKTLGAKSYLYLTRDGQYEFHMSGVPEEFFWKAYNKKYDEVEPDKVFEFFSLKTEIEYTRKRVVFIDEPTTEVINGMEMTSKSGCIIVDEKIVGTLGSIAEILALEANKEESEDDRV